MLIKKRALFICGSLPYPVVSGGRKRELQLLTELGSSYDIHLLCITRDVNKDTANLSHLDNLISGATILSAVPEAECRLSKYSMTENLFKRFHTNNVLFWLKNNLKNFDLVHIERGIIMPTSLLGLCSSIIFSEQNIESEIVNQVIDSESLCKADITIFKDYLKKLQKHENLAWNSASKVLTITKKDAEQISGRISDPSKVVTIPPKFDNKKINTIPKIIYGKIIKLMYLGNFNYHPNKHAAINIIREIIPLLEEKGIRFEFRIVGNGANILRDLIDKDNVLVIDYVENIDEYWNWGNILVAPIYFGSGLKIKIQEALENRMPIITTFLGSSGFEHYIDKYIFVRESPLEIANLIEYFLKHPELYLEITKKLATENLVWNVPRVN